MTAQEFIKGCEHDGSYIPVNEVLRLMNEWAKLMCDKQKEICVDHAFAYREWGNPGVFVEKPSILNAPYPDELQRNN